MENNTVKKKNNDFVDKNITKPTKKIYKNDCWSLINLFQKMKMFKKGSYANNRNNRGERKKKRTDENLLLWKKKKMNYLINHVEELENAWISW